MLMDFAQDFYSRYVPASADGWKRFCYSFNFSLQTVALFLINLSYYSGGTYTCTLSGNSIYDNAENVSGASCIPGLQVDRPLMNSLAVRMCAGMLVVTYPIEMVVRCCQGCRESRWAIVWQLCLYLFACLWSITAKLEVISTFSGDFIAIMSMRLVEVLTYLPLYHAFLQSFRRISMAALPLIVFIYVSAVLAMNLLGLDAVPYSGEDAWVIFVDEYGYSAGFYLEVKDFCKRTACLSRPYFSSIFSGMFSLFQIYTGDSWAEGIAWPLIQYSKSTGSGMESLTMVAFILYVGITTLVIANFVTAVIVDSVLAHVNEASAADSDTSVPGSAAVAQLIQHVQGLEARMERIEQKLDRLLTSGLM